MNQLLKHIKQTGKWPLFIGLLGFSLFSFVLVVYRIKYTASLSYIFLLWNLFLAWIPLLISTFTLTSEKWFQSKLKWIFPIGIWLLFFPNAPYLLTDLLHLGPEPDLPMWYDVLLIFSFAWLGWWLGMLSLMDMQDFITRKFNAKIGWFFAVVAIGLCGFGIYLGRFLRFNSWDVLTDPGSLIGSIASRVLHPLEHGTTYKITFLFSVFMFFSYFLFRVLRKPKGLNEIKEINAAATATVVQIETA